MLIQEEQKPEYDDVTFFCGPRQSGKSTKLRDWCRYNFNEKGKRVLVLASSKVELDNFSKDFTPEELEKLDLRIEKEMTHADVFKSQAYAIVNAENISKILLNNVMRNIWRKKHINPIALEYTPAFIFWLGP